VKTWKEQSCTVRVRRRIDEIASVSDRDPRPRSRADRRDRRNPRTASDGKSTAESGIMPDAMQRVRDAVKVNEALQPLTTLRRLCCSVPDDCYRRNSDGRDRNNSRGRAVTAVTRRYPNKRGREQADVDRTVVSADRYVRRR